MAIEEIMQLVEPPEKPTYIGDDQVWDEFEGALPFALPSDYRDYITTYGYGDLGNMFFVFSPFFPIERGNFLKKYRSIDAEFTEHCQDEGWLTEAASNDLPSLILFGHDTNGSYLHWLTIGEPEEWPVVVGGGRDWEVSRYDGPLTSFLAGVLSGTVGNERYSPNLVKRTFRVVP